LFNLLGLLEAYCSVN